MKHPLLIANNDLGRQDFLQPSQAVVPIDHAAVKIIEIGRSKTSTIKLNHRTEIRWNHWDNVEHHPIGTGTSRDEVIDHAKTFDQLGAFLALTAIDVFTKLLRDFLKAEILKKLLQGFSTNANNRFILNFRFFCVDLIFDFQPFIFRQQLLVLQILVITWIKNDVAVEVNNLLYIAERHIQENGHIARDPLEVPNMGYRSGKLDEAHPMTANPALRDLNTTTFTNNAAVTHTFVLTAVAFPVLRRAKNLLAKKPVHLGLQRPVIDGFRFGDFANHLSIRKGALTPLHHPFGRCKCDLDVIEVIFGAEVAVGH